MQIYTISDYFFLLIVIFIVILSTSVIQIFIHYVDKISNELNYQLLI
jgi:hypothetical protein